MSENLLQNDVLDLNRLRGEDLLIALEGIYFCYGLHDRLRQQGREAIKEVETPRVVCSEALIPS